MGARMQQDNRPLWCRAQRVQHAIQVKAFGLGREVRICRDGQADMSEYLFVIRPGWI